MNIQRIGSGPTHLALIHGWGLGAGVWEPVIDPLMDAITGGVTLHLVSLPGYDGTAEVNANFASTADSLAQQLPPGCICCGWSMGGLLALQAALRHPDKISRLILVGSTPRFVQDDDWPCAQTTAVLDGFHEAISQDAATTLRRFIMLFNQGDANARAISRALTPLLAAHLPGQQTLLRGLSWLGNVDLRSELAHVTQATLLIHGEQDALIPIAAAEALAIKIPRAKMYRLAGAAHAPFHSDPAAFVAAVSTFCNDQQPA